MQETSGSSQRCVDTYRQVIISYRLCCTKCQDRPKDTSHLMKTFREDYEDAPGY